MMIVNPRFECNGDRINDTAKGRIIIQCFPLPPLTADQLAERLCRHLNGEPEIVPAPRIFEDPPAGTKLADWRASVGDGPVGGKFDNVRNFSGTPNG